MTPRAHVLCVDDEPTVRTMVSTVLSLEQYEVHQASSGREALEIVARHEPDLIILDVQMPRMGGYEVCRTIKSNPFTARIPILMLTAQSSIDAKVEGFEAGADDYLGKPFHPRELSARVSALLRLVRRESDRNPSSGLPGGRALREQIERRAHISQDSGEPFALVYLDLDGFKPFADTFGFAAADAVIARTGAALSAACETVPLNPPGSDPHFAGHIGGDDFLIVSPPQCAELLAREAAARFAAAVREVVGAEAAASGVFTAQDREGHAKDFPLATLTAVVLIVPPDRWISVAHLGAFASEQKRLARIAHSSGQSSGKGQRGDTIVVRQL